MRAVWLVLVLLPAIAGCRETHHCEGRNSYQNGMCRPYGDASSGLDGGHDTGSDDAGNDVGLDAFNPCAACGDGSVCFDGEWDGGDSALPLGCVECVDDGQCAGAILPGPDGGGTDAGPPPAGRPICEMLHCVRGCRGDGDCGAGGACRPDHRCSIYPAYATPVAAACAPCDTDGNCPTGLYCVPFRYINGTLMHDGTYCLVESATCGNATRPLARTLGTATSVDGHMGSFCRGASSCQALRDATPTARTCGSEPAACGYADANDATCASGACSISCIDTNDCPLGLNCSGSCIP